MHPGRLRTARTSDNIAIVRHSVNDDPTTSTCHRAQELNIAKTSLLRILKEDLHLYPYKVLTQELKARDHHRRRLFADLMLERHTHDSGFYNKIIFSDEAHFQLNGYVNRQNCRV